MRAEGPARGMEKEILGGSFSISVVEIGGELESERKLEAFSAWCLLIDFGAGYVRGCERSSE